METMKEKLLQGVDACADEMFAVACDIFDHPEYGRTEVYASDLLTRVLEEKGFTVERGLADLPTSFRATWERGTGGPSVGFLLEYDALKGMGHGCGHHMQGPNAIAAALALRDAYPGNFKMVLYGTPDEEIAGGKIDMVNAGCFKDVDVMFGTHTAGGTRVAYGNKALAPTWVTFRGTPAHASGSPWKGRSAMDAMVLCFHGLEVMREHVKDGCRIHYTIKEGTGPSNIVHETANVHITLRSTDRLYLEGEMVPRMHEIVKGACLMTGTTVSSHQIDGTANTLSNSVLEQLLHDNMVIAPLPEYTEEEIVYAKQLKATFAPAPLPGLLTNEDPRLRRLVMEKTDNGHAIMNNFVFPYIPSYKFSPGSTDVGDVSWLTPTAQFTATTWPSGSPGHSWQNVSAGKTSLAHKGMLMAAKILAATAADLMEKPEILAQVREEFSITSAEGYDCPIGPEVIPVIG